MCKDYQDYIDIFGVPCKFEASCELRWFDDKLQQKWVATYYERLIPTLIGPRIWPSYTREQWRDVPKV